MSRRSTYDTIEALAADVYLAWLGLLPPPALDGASVTVDSATLLRGEVYHAALRLATTAKELGLRLHREGDRSTPTVTLRLAYDELDARAAGVNRERPRRRHRYQVFCCVDSVEKKRVGPLPFWLAVVVRWVWELGAFGPERFEAFVVDAALPIRSQDQ